MDLRYTEYHKKVTFKLIFEFLSLGGVFSWVKDNSKNFGSKTDTVVATRTFFFVLTEIFEIKDK